MKFINKIEGCLNVSIESEILKWPIADGYCLKFSNQNGRCRRVAAETQKIETASVELPEVLEGITHVVFGQSARSRWDILLRGSVLNRFLAEVRDATVQVIPMGKKK